MKTYLFGKKWMLGRFVWVFCALLVVCMPSLAQDTSSTEDFDVLVIPVGPSVSAPGRDLSSPVSLEARGLQIVSVPGFALGRVETSLDCLTFRLAAGEAIQVLSLWTDSIPVSATSVYFSAMASTSGEPLQQAALALLDAENPSFEQGVSISYQQDIPTSPREFSLEFRQPAKSVLLLIQAVGPQQGESTLVLERMRLLDGYRELDLSLGTTAVTPVEHFGGEPLIVRNVPPSTEGGTASLFESENHRRFPNSTSRSLRLTTQKEDDVIQVLLPVTILPEALEDSTYPRQFYAEAAAKRLSGNRGTYTLALLSGSTTSVGYQNHSVDTLPLDRWDSVQSPIQLSQAGSNPLYVIIQISGGPADIVVDDVSIQARRDSIFLWDSKVLSPN